MRRVNEAIREVVAETIADQLADDPELGFVTVTDVETSPDLRHAKVYVTVLETEMRESSLEVLERSAGLIQAEINAQMRLKRTPALRFIYDDTGEKAERVERLLRR
jgi:ribosome-binding factor A